MTGRDILRIIAAWQDGILSGDDAMSFIEKGFHMNKRRERNATEEDN